MGGLKPRHINHFFKRIYEVVDIDTGEVLVRANRREYKTVNTEMTSNNIKFNKNGKLTEITKITTRRFVKSNGQTRLEI